MNDAAEQKPQTSPQRSNTQGNPQMQGQLTARRRWVSGQQNRENPQVQDYTNESSLIKELFTVKFAGRMRRAEYWSRLVLLFHLSVVFLSLGYMVLSKNIDLFVTTCGFAWLYLVLVTMGMTVRRLHDAGFSGWTVLWSIIPTIASTLYITSTLSYIASKLTDSTVIASMPMDDFTSWMEKAGIACIACLLLNLLFNLVFTVLLFLNSKPGENKYGRNPKEYARGGVNTGDLSLIKGVLIVWFAGRMRRQDFWLSQLFFCSLDCLMYLMLVMPWGSILKIFDPAADMTRFDGVKLSIILIPLSLRLYFAHVALSMQVRRLHDIGISGWKFLLGIIIFIVVGCIQPDLRNVLLVIGSVILIVLFCRDSQRKTNKWGPNPKSQGDADAQYNLGVCYELGAGVDKDIAEAVKWYRKAADQGHLGAQHNLGVCYYYGSGVDKNYTEAVKWYRLAAEQGFTEAQYNLGVCYHNGDGVNKDYTEAARWYRRAADKGLSEAMYELGKCYLEGTGVEKDEEQVKQWLRKAADKNYNPAKALLRQLEQK